MRISASTAVLIGLTVVGNGMSFAATMVGTQTGPDQWTYELTFAPLDNYLIFPVATESTNPTTITLTGLFGVTGATGPTSTDFPPFQDAINLLWVPGGWMAAQPFNGRTSGREAEILMISNMSSDSGSRH